MANLDLTPRDCKLYIHLGTASTLTLAQYGGYPGLPAILEVGHDATFQLVSAL